MVVTSETDELRLKTVTRLAKGDPIYDLIGTLLLILLFIIIVVITGYIVHRFVKKNEELDEFCEIAGQDLPLSALQLDRLNRGYRQNQHR